MNVLFYDSKLDMRFPATTNHNWQFEITQIGIRIFDRGSSRNPLTLAIQKRAYEFDDYLTGYGITRDNFAHRNSSISVALTGKNGMAERTKLFSGLGNGAAISLLLHPEDVNAGCINSVENVTVEHPYLRSCLLSASSCEYGITWAIWLQFLSPEMKDKEVISGTGETSY
ncbi:hypothetical protein PHET_12468 [Paragonimus heterotremus]|uniref:Uncharacterized protein n=1 Tax=Paragonimus heterotremus TaxID=100268 RepID=A0A8J4SPB8_9TREM|nr:hypothetical protein PHET_12468 [Paragonimus heterotremus]